MTNMLKAPVTDVAGISTELLIADERKQALVSRYAGLLQDAMLYVAKDNSQLETLLARLPAVQSERTRVTFDEWCNQVEANEGTKMDKHILITHAADPRTRSEAVVSGLPGLMLFLPNSVIFEMDGLFTEVRDHNGCKWGDFNKRIQSYKILNPQWKEEKSC